MENAEKNYGIDLESFWGLKENHKSIIPVKVNLCIFEHMVVKI